MSLEILENDNTNKVSSPNISHIEVKDRTVVVKISEPVHDAATRQTIVKVKEFVFPKSEVKKLLQDLYVE